MTVNDIRAAYLQFFQDRGHVVIPSALLLPEHDPTTLFTGSGMQPLLPFLLGEPHERGTRLADSQKCFRSQDIEEVGDNRHTTFFEMLGNWSLGDYFKKEQIPWLFEYLVNEIGLDSNKLYVTCYIGNEEFGIPKDTEAAGLWQERFKEKGITADVAEIGSEADGYERGMHEGERIFYYDGSKNWWSRGGAEAKTPMGDPCGPDTEVFYDFGTPHNPAFGAHCHPNCDCGRFMEVANSVFMAYKRTQNGFEPLQKKNVDFGGGLERIATAKNDNPDVFLIDIFDAPRRILEERSGKAYGEEKKATYAFRVVLDHLRAAVFLIADGAYPSNKDQGYFVRRLIRRSVRFARELGIEGDFSADVARTVLDAYADAYPDLLTKKDKIMEELQKEEKKFQNTLKQGMKKFDALTAGKEPGFVVSGTDAFDLQQSYGFPVEITQEIAKERGFDVDISGFEKEKEAHQALSRKGAEKKFKGGLADHSDMSVKYHTATHLLHASVLEVLGPHAVQKGSNITPERLRFDFAHTEKPTDEQLQRIEGLVNAAIERDYPVSWAMLSIEEAKAKDAIGLFEEKYEEKVKVYTIGDPKQPAKADPQSPTFSREFCGGPHVEHTGVLGHFCITKEEAVSAGVRRIKAVLE